MSATKVEEKLVEAVIPAAEIAEDSLREELPLKDKLCLVYDATRGIGRATVMALARAGGRIAILEPPQRGDMVDGLRRDLRSHAVDCNVFLADPARREATNHAIADVICKMGPISVLVTNAGPTCDGPFLKLAPETWDATLNVNLTGVFNLGRAVLPFMLELGWGRIINVTSVYGEMEQSGGVNSTVAQLGTVGLTMALAREAGRSGITVNAVVPGLIETDPALYPPERQAESLAEIPLKRLGTPEEVAAVIAFLASPASSFITGQTLGVNGGLHIHS